MANDFTDQSAREMRAHWFNYLDVIEPERTALHAYCKRLTRNLWDAEDLLQDTLLKGFAMTARGDFHGENSPVRDARAYLFRTATNLWLDTVRRQRRFSPLPADETAMQSPSDPDESRDAMNKAVGLTTPREFCAMLLKDVYDFSLEDIADFIGTTTGTVKSVLSRARTKMKPDHTAPARVDPQAKALALAFSDAMNTQDVDRIVALMSETLKIDVCNVGGGRGRRGIWTEKSVQGVTTSYAEYDGEPLILLFYNNDPAIGGVVRLEGDGGVATRLIDYHFAPETVEEVASHLGLDWVKRGAHQAESELVGMIASTGLAWR